MAECFCPGSQHHKFARCCSPSCTQFCFTSKSVLPVEEMACLKVVKSEGKSDCSFLPNEDFYYGNSAVLTKLHKTTKLFEFVLDILSEPRYSAIISWEGTEGQFAIKRPDQVAFLWGKRNGRPNMTYQKFSRALRYYYHKKVLTKIRGRNCVYKFDFRELEKQYGYHSNIPSPTTAQLIAGNGTNHYEIPATCGHFQNPSSEHHLPASTELIDSGSYGIPAVNPAMCGYSRHPHEANRPLAGALYSVLTPVMVQGLVHSPSCLNSHYFPYH